MHILDQSANHWKMPKRKLLYSIELENPVKKAVCINLSSSLKVEIAMIGRRIEIKEIVDSPRLLDEERQLKRVNDYLILKKIGKGSMSKVYVAMDSQRKLFALKRIDIRELSKSSSGVMSLEREIRLTRMFKHENILNLIEVLHDTKRNFAYLVLEYATCGSLGRCIRDEYHFTEDEIRSIIYQSCLALNYLHEKNFVHQDVKPDNILLQDDGRIMLADFGIGHSFQSAAMVLGTPAYQAPEAFSDSEDEEDEEDEEDYNPLAEDVWALGVTVYQLCFLKLPFPGENVYEIIHNIRTNPLKIPSGISQKMTEIIRQMLALVPATRISIQELLEDPYINTAPRCIHIPPLPIDDVDQTLPIKEIHATHCDKDYCFSSVCMNSLKLLSEVKTAYGHLSSP